MKIQNIVIQKKIIFDIKMNNCIIKNFLIILFYQKMVQLNNGKRTNVRFSPIFFFSKFLFLSFKLKIFISISFLNIIVKALFPQ